MHQVATILRWVGQHLASATGLGPLAKSRLPLSELSLRVGDTHEFKCEEVAVGCLFIRGCHCAYVVCKQRLWTGLLRDDDGSRARSKRCIGTGSNGNGDEHRDRNREDDDD